MTTTRERPLALVTGASSGIGLELARQFAEHGFDLMINAEDDGIFAVAEELGSSDSRVQPIQADLTTYDGVETLYAAIRRAEQPLDAAALNAGVGEGGAFVSTDLNKELEIIDLNVRSTVHLAKRVLTDMVAQDHGRLLITSSIASMMPGTYQAVYNASKSFLQSFAQALRTELKDTDVTVTALMPGPTDTEFFARAGMQETPIGKQDKDDPAQVARQGFDALMSGKSKTVAGSAKTKLQGAVSKVLPDKAKAAMHSRMAEPTD